MRQGTQDRPAARSLGQRCVVGLRRLVRTLLAAIGLYLLIVLVGLIPVNNDFEPTPGGVEILITSNPVHASLVLPIDTATIDWREHFPADCFSDNTSDATHVSIGWGDKGVLIEAQFWADLRIATAAKAVFWLSDSCMHVALTQAENERKGSRSVTISVAQYERLVEYIRASFQQASDGSHIQIDDAAYKKNDAFFLAHGSYHCLNTCNCWAGRVMRSGGIRTGWFTPLPKTVFLWLPE